MLKKTVNYTQGYAPTPSESKWESNFELQCHQILTQRMGEASAPPFQRTEDSPENKVSSKNLQFLTCKSSLK